MIFVFPVTIGVVASNYQFQNISCITAIQFDVDPAGWWGHR